MFLRPVSQVICSELAGAGVACSPKVLARQISGRHALIIHATSAVKYGDKDNQLIEIPAGESVIIPLTTDRLDQIYVSGPCSICECF